MLPIKYASALLLCIFSAPLLHAQCEVQSLNGSRVAPFDYFGKSAHMEGDSLIIGAFAANNPGPGAAYVFERMNDMWIETGRLVGDDSQSGDELGNSVGISGNFAVAGAEFNDNEIANNAGAAYVFEKTAGGWVQAQKLLASDGFGNQHFGEYVAISGDTIVVGAREDKDYGNNSGAAYVFERTALGWVETAKLKGSDGARNDLTGDTLAIQGDRIVIASYRNDASSSNSGAAYVFERTAGGWAETAKLVADDAAGEMGRGVALDGDRIVLGARLDNTLGSAAGSAYVFDLVGGTWTQTAKLLPSAVHDGSWAGEAVAVQGDTIIVSGHHTNYRGFDSGVAFVFEQAGGAWQETAILAPSDLAPIDEFSFAVTMSGDRAVLTSPLKNSSSGAAYSYEFGTNCGGPPTTEPGVVAIGEGLGGANVGVLETASAPIIETQMTYTISGIPNGTAGILWFSVNPASQMRLGGTLLASLNGTLLRLPYQLTGGATSIDWTVPVGALGYVVYAQAGALDASQPEGIALTNGLQITFGE